MTLQSKQTCEFFSKNILPTLRALIAKGLIEDHGLTQTAAAEKLGITQAAISYYISSKRGEKYAKQLKNDPQSTSIIEETINGLAEENLSMEGVMEKLCKICMVLRKNKYSTIK